MLKCLDKNNIHNPQYLITVYEKFNYLYNDQVKWCTECSAIVIDEEYDCRINPGAIRKMEFPKCHRQ